MKSLFKIFPAIFLVFFCTIALNAQEDTTDYDAEYAVTLLKQGTTAPDFTLNTNEGKEFSLSSLKGSYIVLDFWASWCPDCRKEIPNVKRMYKNFSPKGVKFVGISFDDKEEQWQNAIKEYDLEYINVSELKRMRDSKIAKTYGIKWIPSMYLIGPDGKVILSTVMSSKLEKALADAIGNK
jgi:peroxiredoxin